MKTPHKFFKMRDWIWVGLIVILVIVYHRPLTLQYDDPGEEYFTMDEHDLPSAWADLQDRNSVFGYDYTGDKLDAVHAVDEALSLDRQKTSQARHRDTGYETQYIVYSGSKIASINRDNVDPLLTGTTGQDIQSAIDLLGSYISGTELYPESFAPDDVIPQSKFDSTFRMGILYSVYLCEVDETDQCVDNIMSLMNFTQKYKSSGTLMGLFVATAQEGMLLNYVDYIQATNPDSAEVLIENLRTIDYVDAYDILVNSYKGEYHMLKSSLEEVKNATMADMYDGYEVSYMAREYMNLIKIKFFSNSSETLKVARGYYKTMIEHIDASTSEKDHLGASLESMPGRPKPAWSRSNPIGYMALRAFVPQFTGVSERIYQAQERFEALIGQ